MTYEEWKNMTQLMLDFWSLHKHEKELIMLAMKGLTNASQNFMELKSPVDPNKTRMGSEK